MSELRHIILDNGAGRIKYGPPSLESNLGGEADTAAQSNRISQNTRNSMPNCVARMNKQMQVLVGDEVDGVANGSLLTYTRPFERGYMTNVHCQIEVWSRLFNKILNVSAPAQTSLLLTEAPFCPESMQNDMNEVLFEDFGFGECLRRPAAWFSAYEFAATNAAAPSSSSSSSFVPSSLQDPRSCIVVDSGFSFSHVFPFVQGKCVKKAVKRVNVGGKLLTNYLKELVSYRQWNMMEEFPLVDQVKEDLCYVSENFQADLQAAHASAQRVGLVAKEHNNTAFCCDRPKRHKASGPQASAATLTVESSVDDRIAARLDPLGLPLKRGFVMPDYSSIMRGYVRPLDEASHPGQQELMMETERFTVPEVLFYPSDVGMEQGGIGDALCESIASMNVIDAGLAAANIVLTGGNCRFPQFASRLYAECRPAVPDMYDISTFLPPHPDYYAWQGASRFVEQEKRAGTLSAAFVTRAEYLERGHMYVNEKFWKGW